MSWAERERTITDDEKINTQNGKSFPNAIIRILKLALHDGGINFDENDASKTSKNHPIFKVRLVAGLDGQGAETHFRRPH